MNHLSFEQHGHHNAESVKINPSERSLKHNEAHRRNYDNDNEIGLIDTDMFFKEEDMFIDLEEEVSDETKDGETVEKVIQRWDSEEDLHDEEDTQEEEIGSLVVETSDYLATPEELTNAESAPTQIDSASFEAIQDGAFMISAESVQRYALAYPGGYKAFEDAFIRDWVEKIQDPITVKRPSLVKKFGTNKMDVFTQFSHVTLEEFNEVVALPAVELEEYLAEHHMDAEDFENWKKVIEYWENSDKLAFSVKTSFGDIARGAFAAKLEEDKQAISD